MTPADTGKTRSRRVVWGFGVVVLLGVTAVGVALGLNDSTPKTAEPTFSAAPGPTRVARRELRPTLDPVRFVGKAAVGHQIARDIPDVLDQLYCYCECDKHAGHKSLLSCYTDGHAAT